MAEIVKSGTPSPSTVLPDAGERVGTFTADVDITAGTPCRLTSTGCTPSSGAAATSSAFVHGWAGETVKQGQPVVLWTGINFGYSSTPAIVAGTSYFLSATVAGQLSDAATTGGVNACAFGLPGGRIRVLQVLKTS